MKLQIARVVQRIEGQGLTLHLTDAALDHLSKEGYDPAYGARPLKRVIQKLILDPISLNILEGKYPEGSKITVDFNGQIIYS